MCLESRRDVTPLVPAVVNRHFRGTTGGFLPDCTAAEENIWTKEAGSNRRARKTA
jgi:hypothetical protein